MSPPNFSNDSCPSGRWSADSMSVLTRCKPWGIQIVVGDFADYASLLGALDGIEAAYFSYPVGAGLTEAAGLFAAAGCEQDLQLVVDLSLDAAFPEVPARKGTPNGSPRSLWRTC